MRSSARTTWRSGRTVGCGSPIRGQRKTSASRSGHPAGSSPSARPTRERCLFVATTVSQGVTVISPHGAVLGEIHLGEYATNCIFDGPDLYVTATREADIEASQRTGTFWRVETDATGLELIPGELTTSVK